MKTTILVFNDLSEPEKGLRVASIPEWNRILKDNKSLPAEKRRVFIKDCFMDDKELDCMFIETTYEETRKAERGRKSKYRNEKEKGQYSFVSLSDHIGNDEDALTIEDTIDCGFCLEDCAIDNIMFDNLRAALARWNTWAPELLDLYLEGNGRTCNAILMAKYGVSESLMARRKRRFKEFVQHFLSGGVQF